ncbi:DUF1543 domain-containing protein [Acinetobacter nectaris]|uniref:DUF1543 domain-containing protein n=1 Tax=Acinetobacter nectaris TaxID=1219382 RepID=UPI001F3B47CD|nr:DUF1543 domain-containing protein [Acinetobacter nectaris]MCF8998344.1 DUF1543 domain-containing protein [Acinetobacter nectaris]MCF9027804.1 DUF1543 domain-containing protein [Acinetobacter nectaris]
MSQENLYIVLLGGKHEKANIEVHDIRPVICSNLSDAYTALKKQWFGVQKGLHIDGWMKINGVHYHNQPYQITISEKPQLSDLKPYLINLGAYIPQEFGEVHKYLIVAGMNPAEAKQQGKQAIEKHWFKPHTDAVVDVDACIELSLFDQKYIHLVKGTFEPNSFENDYIVIG